MKHFVEQTKDEEAKVVASRGKKDAGKNPLSRRQPLFFRRLVYTQCGGVFRAPGEITFAFR